MPSIKITSQGVNIESEEKLSLRPLSDYSYKKDIREKKNPNNFSIIIIQKGSGNYTIDFNSYEINTNQVIIISQGQKHGLSKNSTILEGWELTFSKSFLDENEVSNSFLNNINLYNTYGDRLPMRQDIKIFNSINNLIQQMLDLEDQELKLKIKMYSCFLQLILIKIHNLSSEISRKEDSYSNAAHKNLTKFRDMVEVSFKDHHKVAFYADKMSITPDHLNKTVKSLLNISAKDLIQTRILTEAKRMIVHNNISSKQLSFKLGFKDPSHFSNFFKNSGLKDISKEIKV